MIPSWYLHDIAHDDDDDDDDDHVSLLLLNHFTNGPKERIYEEKNKVSLTLRHPERRKGDERDVIIISLLLLCDVFFSLEPFELAVVWCGCVV